MQENWTCIQPTNLGLTRRKMDWRDDICSLWGDFSPPPPPHPDGWMDRHFGSGRRDDDERAVAIDSSWVVIEVVIGSTWVVIEVAMCSTWIVIEVVIGSTWVVIEVAMCSI